jgi:hypothetical protein
VIYRSLTQLTALVLVGLGVAMVAVTAAYGGGDGIVLGVLFVLAGAGRLWLLRRRR